MRSSGPELPIARQPPLYRCQGFPCLPTALLCDGGVVEVFPELPIFAQVNHNTGLLASLIHHKLHAFHNCPPCWLGPNCPLFGPSPSTDRIRKAADKVPPLTNAGWAGSSGARSIEGLP